MIAKIKFRGNEYPLKVVSWGTKGIFYVCFYDEKGEYRTLFDFEECDFETSIIWAKK